MSQTFVPWNPARPNGVGWRVDESGCHIWKGARGAYGYGRVWDGGRLRCVHRVRYEREVGSIPDGMVLDHYVCDNGRGGCCNPLHCRPVTNRENVLRGVGPTAQNAKKTHCPNGHELSPDNLAKWDYGRNCLECSRVNRRKRMAKLSAKRRAATTPPVAAARPSGEQEGQ